MAKRLTIEQRIERAQELGEQRWNRMIHAEEDQIRRDLAKTEREALTRRSQMKIVQR